MKFKKIIYLVIFLVVVAGIYFILKNDMSAGAKETKFENDLKLALPVGTDVKGVLSYLDANKVEHSEVDKENHQIVVVFRNIDQNIFVNTDLQITFHFDENGKLLNFLSKEFLTGL